jgi:protein-tyrosine-phosphatase
MTDVRPIRILFLCVENACRSSMAEAFARLHGADRVVAQSAGSRPAASVHFKAVESMRELGIDLAARRPQSLAALDGHEFDCVVTMGCGEACPLLPARRREDWNIPDPKDMSLTDFRGVRELIEKKVKVLVRQLTA